MLEIQKKKKLPSTLTHFKCLQMLATGHKLIIIVWNYCNKNQMKSKGVIYYLAFNKNEERILDCLRDGWIVMGLRI